MKKILIAAAFVAASASTLAFQAGMTPTQVNTEVAQRIAGGESLESIATAANAVGIAPAAVQTAMVIAGQNSTTVFNALVTAGANPTVLLPPTAAGNSSATGGLTGGTTGGTLTGGTTGGTLTGGTTGSFSGFSGSSSFGTSRAATVGGGGKSSVSPT